MFSLRIIVRDNHGKTLYNSFTDLVQRDDSPLIEGDSVRIVDYDTFEITGTITVYINQDFLERETGEYILGILKPRIIQGFLTIVIALVAAALLSRRITSPIKALTRATRGISQRGKTQLLPVNSADELGQMSQSFNQMITSLQKQRELRKRLISDVSHEINNPLNVIRLEAKGLQDEIITSDEASARIIDEVDTLSNLIHDLDWLAETDSGEFKLKKDYYPIGKIIQTEVDRWQLNAQIAELRLELTPLPRDLPILYIDAMRISQVLGNLLENGLKYSKAHGSVTVSCEVENQKVVISIADTGPGIPAVDLPYVFERFYRVDQSRVRSKGGRGLGLSIVKQIVEMHNGCVWAESRKGEGSCFYFSLPAPQQS
ncbi:MAG: HAMP domain-containing histidine kinase, partial [Spirochaetaceae bacterium]|nr:HAMP domain-containing histidine kinase [Spirochaetaceae bacterium]